MSYSEEVIKILKAHGYKITKPRQLVLKTLTEAEEPLSSYDISDMIKQSGEKGDVVSIYRTLEILENIHLIHKVISSGKYLKCNLKLEEDMAHPACHHNLVCKKCGRLKEIDCTGFDLFVRVVSSEHAFQVENHALEFYGLCSSCRNSSEQIPKIKPN